MPRMPRVELPDPYKVEIVLDSISPAKCRLTTFALTYPRFVHSELLTHRIFSRNSASSRAIPSEKMRELVREHPALPVWWGKNQAGMQAREELSDVEPYRPAGSVMNPNGDPKNDAALAEWDSPRAHAKRLWLEARDVMIEYSDRLAKLGLHKQLCNRLTEPWMPITVLVSSTSFANWFHLRDHRDAQPEIQVIATEMHYQYIEHKPTPIDAGGWHLPYIHAEDQDEAIAMIVASVVASGTRGLIDRRALLFDMLKKVSVGRCARVSYLTHEGVREMSKDIELHDKLAATAAGDDPGHFSPFEHVAMALDTKERIGNFIGWKQYRKTFENEAGPRD